MSTNKKWCVSPNRELHGAETAELARSLGVLEPTAVLLYNRGFTTPEAAEKFLCKDEICFHNPFLLEDMEPACARIELALARGERIVIYGDYDVDGVTAVSTLLLYLRSLGADVGYYIPNRCGEGYGINGGALSQLAREGCRLLVTVDTGITAVDEIAMARELGMDVIVTDHHECPARLPEATAVVNPKRADSRYPFPELAGVGVVFKLLCALEYRRSSVGPPSDWLRALCENYIDLVALGTVADVMPLVDENRLIVSLGLQIIENTKRPGLAALLELSGVTPPPSAYSASTNVKKKRITSSLIGYVIAPRINAAGRLSCASKAVELFLTDSPDEAKKIALELCDTNRERQAEENGIIEQTYKKIEDEHNFDRDYVIVLDENSWHHGVIGIVSSRITEHYNLPSILISFEGCSAEGCEAAESDVGKGSGRSVKGLNLVEALNTCGDLLVKYGGHELAAGLTIERGKLPEFRRRINDYARTRLDENDQITNIDVDCELEPEEITLRQTNELFMLEPYGIANPVPIFVLRDARIAELSAIGAGKHTKMTLERPCGYSSNSGGPLTAIYFGVSPQELDFYPGDFCDLIFNLSVNDFMGVQTAQLIVRDIDGSRSAKADRELSQRLYEEIKDGRQIARGENFVPSRDDFVSVYLYIKYEVRQGMDTLSLHRICHHFAQARAVNPVKLRFIIDILLETNILGVERINQYSPHASPRTSPQLIVSRGEELYKFKINYISDKVNLEKSTIYKRLKSRQEK